MKTFEEIKSEILKLGKEKSACQGQFERALESSNIDELMSVVKDNFTWCYNNQVITIDILNSIGESKSNKFGIYFKGEIERLENLRGLIFCGDFKCEMLGNSQVGEMWGNSQVGKMWGNSQVGKMLDNSQVGKMWDNSQVGKMWGNSFARSYNGNLPKEKCDKYCFVDLRNNLVYLGENLTLAL